MYSFMKMEKCIEFELSDIFRVNLVNQTPGNNAEQSLECGVSFRRIMQIFWTRLLHLFSLFNSILVWIMSKKPFCLISLLFPFAGPRGPIDAEMLQNYFMYMRVNMSYTKHWIKKYETEKYGTKLDSSLLALPSFVFKQILSLGCFIPLQNLKTSR